MVTEGSVLWVPSNDFIENTNIINYIKWLKREKNLAFGDYHSLWKWSVDELVAFWESIWEYFDVQSSTAYEEVLSFKEMPSAKWFTGATLNYAEHIFRRDNYDKTAICHASEIRPLGELNWGDFKKQVMSLATELRALGVGRGDRIAAYLPNIPETVVAMMATMSIGAVWSSVSPDFGSRSVLDRLQQIKPKVLFTIDGYQYAGKTFDRREEVVKIAEQLPTVEHFIHVPYLIVEDTIGPIESAKQWSELLNRPAPQHFEFEQVPFDHPLQIMYSSGTTGIPKAIVHSHGGILLESYKILTFHANLGPKSRLLFYTTTGWMMFNILTSGLLTGASIVLYDGNPAYPSIGKLWELAEQTGTTAFGASPMYVNLMKQAGLSPKDKYDLSSIESIILSGAPAGPELFEWIYKHVKEDLWLSSQSGGTDICSGFLTGVPIEPVTAGEMQARGLGVDVHAFTEDGKSVVGKVGELVVLQPMPSMPLYFLNDEGNKRLFESYFDMFPGIWRQGDNLKLTERGTGIIYGRSDSTLNRNGVRMGTSEIYSAVESLDAVKDSLIVYLQMKESRSFMPLFVALNEGAVLDESLKQEIRDIIRNQASPKHVPDEIYAIEQVPYTLTGKKMEVPVRKILCGVPVEEAANPDAMANPTSLQYFSTFWQKEQSDEGLATHST